MSMWPSDNARKVRRCLAVQPKAIIDRLDSSFALVLISLAMASHHSGKDDQKYGKTNIF